jgi:hypothetical protein
LNLNRELPQNTHIPSGKDRRESEVNPARLGLPRIEERSMPDRHRIHGELATLLSRPQYASIFSHHNQFRNQYRHCKKPDDPLWTPGSVAKKTAQDLHACNGLLVESG